MARSQAYNCLTCENGILNVTIFDYSKQTSNIQSIPCIDCEGKGQITESAMSSIQRRNSVWCKCKVSENIYYVERSEECSKHHWKCNVCNKIFQVG